MDNINASITVVLFTMKMVLSTQKIISADITIIVLSTQDKMNASMTIVLCTLDKFCQVNVNLINNR